jgi:hypothetical protein
MILCNRYTHNDLGHSHNSGWRTMHDIRIEQLPKWTSPAADGPIESEQEIRVPLKQEQVQVTK